MPKFGIGSAKRAFLLVPFAQRIYAAACVQPCVFWPYTLSTGLPFCFVFFSFGCFASFIPPLLCQLSDAAAQAAAGVGEVRVLAPTFVWSSLGKYRARRKLDGQAQRHTRADRVQSAAGGAIYSERSPERRDSVWFRLAFRKPRSST